MKFIFIAVLFILLQCFTYLFAKAIIWQFQCQRPYIKRIIYSASFLFSNTLLVITALRIGKMSVRIMANWLVLLLFIGFTALIILTLYYLIKLIFPKTQPHPYIWRILAPFTLISIYSLALYNAYTPVVRYAKITINKPLQYPIRIGMASDLHLGKLFGVKQLDKLAEIMQTEKVDIILLPGDIMDDDTIAYEAENMQPHLAKLKAPLGVYATLGNHDLFGHEKAITQAIEKAGIRVLTDEAVWVDNRIWVIGRPDELDRHRLPTPELLPTNTDAPIFLLDHRPTSITQHAQLPIDIQVSGHVHNGQIFPANLIVRFLNRLHYGYEQINQGHFFVTSGYGFWGVPLRLGSQSEVWIIDVEGKQSH